MKLVRRSHLYAGLFMTPWVFLYGVTAFLFNHPAAFPDAKIVRFGPSETAGTPLAEIERPEALARRVVDALNASRAGGASDTLYRLVRPAEARFVRDFFASVRGGDEEYLVRIDLGKGEGTIRSQAKPSKEAAPFVSRAGVKLDPLPMKVMTRGLPALLQRAGISGEKTVDRSIAPDLSFLMAVDGRTWRVNYSPQSGQLSGRPETDRGRLSTRAFLLRLHLSREYPSERDARWYWAVAVDAMFISMIGWGITGLLMWWQMKNVRKVGIAVLIASALAATAVAIGMHRLLTA